MRDDKIIKNKYDLPIEEKCFKDYINNKLVNKIFKLLPLYEGKSSITKQIIYTPEEAYVHYKMHLREVIIEAIGDYYLYKDNSNFLELLSILEGLKDININEHQALRTIVFKCTNLCNKLSDEE